MNPLSAQQLILIVIVVIDFIIATYVLIKNPKRIVNRAFFIFVLGMGLFGAGMILLFATKLFIFDKVLFFGGHIMMFGLLLLSKVFPNLQHVERRFYLYLIPLFAVAVATPFNLLVQDIVVDPDGTVKPVLGVIFPFFLVATSSYVALIMYWFIRNYLKVSGLARLQMKYLFVGTVTFIVAMFIFSVLLPAFGVFRLNIIGPMSSIVFIGFVAYAIVRHQLLDIRIVIQRGAIYSALLVGVVVSYLALLSGIGYLFQRTTDVTILVSAGLTALIGIFGVPPLEHYFRRITDKIFFKDRYEYADAMHKLSEILNKNLDLEQLITRLIQALKGIFRAEKACIFLIPQNILFGYFDKPQVVDKVYSDRLVSQLERYPEVILQDGIPRILDGDSFDHEYHETLVEIQKLAERGGIEVTVPIVLERKLRGMLALGKKLSGDAYTSDDARLLHTLSHQLAVALEKAELYKKVRDYSRELEKRVKERTAELQELQEGQKRMMIDISHALQTPLTVVKGELDILKKQVPVSKDLEVFEKSVDDVSHLTYDLLKLARLETSQEDFKKEVFDISRVLSNLVEYFTTLAENQGVAVASSIEPGIKMAGQKTQLEELVTNLLANALKYMPDKKEKKIKIDLRRERDVGTVKLVVKDTGAGISKEDLPHIFEAFYRTGKKDGFGAGGTGLGLAICKVIVEKHGGKIEVASELGGWTKFTVTFQVL